MKVAMQHNPRKQKAADVYLLKVTLDNIEPPIWRRIEVPGDIDLKK
jgi:hypothetical protein